MDRGRQPRPRCGRGSRSTLAHALTSERVAHVYTSTLARAVQTAEIVAASLDIGVTTRLGLREFDAGYLASARTTSTRCWPCTTAGSAATSTRGCRTGSRPRSSWPGSARSSTRSPLATRARPSWSSRTAERSASVCRRCAAWTRRPSPLQCATTFVVARHGEAEYEAPTWAEEGGSLTTRGRRQAAELAETLTSSRVAHVWTVDPGPRRPDRRDRRGAARASG